ncbi:MAG TPA: Trk system potassium transporter TrkA [Polyangiaceae bacterium]|nr:Trk system potassium transporter TrkA [Polyangiaceae bacterium]
MRISIFGAGDVGAYLARDFSQGHEVVLVDRDSAALARAEEDVDALTVVGDATHRSVLQAAEVARCDLAVAVTGSDDTNLVIAGLAAALGAERTVARVDAPAFYASAAGVEPGVLGVHSLLCASRLVSEELARLIECTEASFAMHFAGNALQVAVLPLPNDSPALGLPATHATLNQVAQVVGVVRDSTLRVPEAIDRLELEDSLLLSGSPQSVQLGARALRKEKRERRAVVVGGGDVGLQLATMLLGTEHEVQIIDHDRARCQVLAETLPGANVVHGDGTSIGFLRDEHVDSADYLVAVTRADEINLMASLMGINLGVSHTFALVHRPGHAEVYSHLGISGTAGTHDVITKIVGWLMPHKGPVASHSLPGTGHLLQEFVVGGTPGVAVPLRRLGLPSDAWVVAASREGRALPVGQGPTLTTLDRVVVALPPGQARQVHQRMRAIEERP